MPCFLPRQAISCIPGALLVVSIVHKKLQICYEKTIANYDDKSALGLFAAKADVITYEFENIPLETVSYIAQLAPVRPKPDILAICQNRVKEKSFCRSIGVPTTKFEQGIKKPLWV